MNADWGSNGLTDKVTLWASIYSKIKQFKVTGGDNGYTSINIIQYPSRNYEKFSWLHVQYLDKMNVLIDAL